MGTPGKIVLGIVGVFVVGFVALIVWGMGLYEDEVCDHLKAQPAIVGKLGPLTLCEQRTLSTGEIEDFDTFVFAVEGPQGVGRAYVKSTSDGEDGAEVYQGILLVVGGEEILVEGERPPTN